MFICKIISGFAGVGKSTVALHHKNILDLESSDFHWEYEDEDVKNMDKEERKGQTARHVHPEWPRNYIESILAARNSYDHVLISMDSDVRAILDNEGIEYTVAFPSKESKEEYIERYRSRGNNENFVKLLESKFDEWVEPLYEYENKIVIEPGKYLEDYLFSDDN